MITYGNLPVPWAVMWSSEDEYFVGKWIKAPAICQRQSQSIGTPVFGAPNVDRQRKVHTFELCDLCAKSLRNSTKLSVSNFGGKPQEGAILTQSEPLLHVECAQKSLRYCPSLRRQAEDGRLGIRQVYSSRPRVTVATREERERFVPQYDGPNILGLAVTDLLKWRDITQSFLEREFSNVDSQA